jgi:adenosylhomocysteine nucleosidase
VSEDVVIVFALQREAEPFQRRKLKVCTIVSGVGSGGAEFITRVAIEAWKPRLVVAAGYCGALSPHLKVGDIVTSPRILTVGHVVGDPAEKKALFETTGADAVDMESAAVQAVCTELGTPFLAVRAVSDTSDTRLSPALLKVLTGGKVSWWKAFAAALRRPSLFAEYNRLAGDTKIAGEKLADALAAIVTK